MEQLRCLTRLDEEYRVGCMTQDDVHLALAFCSFFLLFVAPIAAMIMAILWFLFAYLVEDYGGE